MASREAEALSALYRSWAERIAANPGMPIDEFRALFEEWATVTAEPQGVAFEEAALDGLPILWARPDQRRRNALLICFHGGGYFTGSRSSHRKLFGHIAAAAGVTAMIVEYRRAPEHPFPAAVEDGLRAYRWALDNGIDANSIAFVGDSAGGGLSVGTALAARRDGLAMPGGLFLMSPWLDLGAAGASYDSNADRDLIVSRPIIEGLVPAILGEHGSIDDPIANPIRSDPGGLPPMLIQVGGDEAFLDDSREFTAAARRAGVDVDLVVVPEMQHVFQFLAGNAPEADAAIAQAGAWLRARLVAK